MIGVCVKCGERFEIDDNEKLSDYQCHCGGNLIVEGAEVKSTKSEFKNIQRGITKGITNGIKAVKSDKKRGKIKIKSREKPKEKDKLIDCLDCGQKISRKAIECPNCGRPTGRKLDSEWLLIAIILPPVGFLGGIYFAVKERKDAIPMIFFSIAAAIGYWILIFTLLMQGFR